MADFETNELQLMMTEKFNTGTARTNNDEMEKNGYVVEVFGVVCWVVFV